MVVETRPPDTPRRTVNRMASGLAMALLSAMSSGCAMLLAGTAATSGEIALRKYMQGNLESYLEAPAWECEQAVKAVLRQYEELSLTERGCVGQGMCMTYTNPQQQKLQITLEPLTENNTRIGIRAGYWGDEVVAEKLLDEFARHIAGSTNASGGSVIQ